MAKKQSKKIYKKIKIIYDGDGTKEQQAINYVEIQLTTGLSVLLLYIGMVAVVIKKFHIFYIIDIKYRCSTNDEYLPLFCVLHVYNGYFLC